VVRLHDQHALVLADDPTALAEDDRDQAGVAADLVRDRPGLRGDRDLG
jgi:hypothetical protein